MNRVVMWSVLIGLATLHPSLQALEVGALRVHSNPDQAFSAELQLRPAPATNPAQLQVQLASADEFRRAGLDPQAASLDLQFSLHPASHGGYWLHMDSRQPLPASYHEILLAITDRAGRSLHELPLAARAGSLRTAAKASPAAADSFKVGAGQTLSALALRHRVAGASLDQMLLAYQRLNPQAFYADNVSALKAGAILRVPSQADVAAATRAEAYRAINQQNRDWRAGRPGRPSVLATAAAATPASTAPQASASDDRLSLRAGQGLPQAAQAALLDQETLRATQQQADDLSSRVHDLQVMQQEREHLIALKSRQIQQLQQQLNAARQQRSRPAPLFAPGSLANHPTRMVWIWGAGIVLLLILFVLLRGRRRTPPAMVTEPALEPAPAAPANIAAAVDTEQELRRLNQRLQTQPDNLDLYFQLASLYYARHDVAHFVAIAETMHGYVQRAHDPDWAEVQAMGRDLLPGHPLFVLPAEPATAAPVAGSSASKAATAYAAVQTPIIEASASLATPSVAPASPVAPTPVAVPAAADTVPSAAVAPTPMPAAASSGYSAPDAVDTKLDLARAYLDMQAPASARAMLQEVLAEGSQIQQDVARELLASLPAE